MPVEVNDQHVAIFEDGLQGNLQVAGGDFRREIRRNYFDPNRPVIVLPDFQGDMFISQVSPKGSFIDSYTKDGGVSVTIRSPPKPLFYLEGKPLNVPEGGLDSRIYALGADERFSVSEFSPQGLELLLCALVQRSTVLKRQAINGDMLRQFYPYGMYNLANSTLVSRLLASAEVSPHIQSEMRSSVHHYWGDYYPKERCASCDRIAFERENFRKNPNESRVVILQDDTAGGYILLVPFAAPDPLRLDLLPLQHVARLTDLSPAQINYTAHAIYSAIDIIIKRAHKINRGIDTVEISLHSVPFYNFEEIARLNGFLKDESTANRVINSSYHFHVEIAPGKITRQSESYQIPGTGWTVVPGRLKDSARELRKILSD